MIVRWPPRRSKRRWSALHGTPSERDGKTLPQESPDSPDGHEEVPTSTLPLDGALELVERGALVRDGGFLVPGRSE